MSSNCVTDDSVTLDLSVHLRHIRSSERWEFHERDYLSCMSIPVVADVPQRM